MEKTAIPDAMTPKETGNTYARRHLVPYMVATAAVSALVVACVLGSMYIHELRMKAQEINETNNKADNVKVTYNTEFEDDSGKVKEVISVDKENEKELIVQRNASGFLINVVAADFNKGVMSVYSREQDSCYIVIGTETFLPTWEALEESRTNPNNGLTVELRLTKVSDTEIQDNRVLPDDMLQFCQDTPLFWAKHVTEETGIKMRRKRGWSFKITIKITITF